MSCMSKLGAPSMSRSSTATGAGTPCGFAPHIWTLHNPDQHQSNNCPNSTNAKNNGIDRMSICSSHGSSSNNSEYSVPRLANDSWFDKSSSLSLASHINAAKLCTCANSGKMTIRNNALICSQCGGAPPRPPKPKPIQKPPMPLPLNSLSHVGPYENYDIPKMPISVEATIENYDTPKKMQEFILSQEQPVQTSSSIIGDYGNYDMPATIGKMCGCMGGMENPEANNNQKEKSLGEGRANCACNRVMSWADNWISLPYCRRGNGIENTGIPINRVKLSGEGKMPVVQPYTGQLAIYATVDMTKKIKKRLTDMDIKTCKCASDEKSSGDDQTSESGSSNYINLDPHKVLALLANPNGQQKPSDGNYSNLNFAHSLENYENSKEVLHRVSLMLASSETTENDGEEFYENEIKICRKCGHASELRDSEANNDSTGESSADQRTMTTESKESVKESNFLIIDQRKSNPDFPGYLPMSPAAPTSQVCDPSNPTTPVNAPTPTPPPPHSSANKTDMIKQRVTQIIMEKSASNPSLNGGSTVVDRSKKRTDDDTRIPGSAMMILHRSGVSPYTRKQLMDASDLIPTSQDKRLICRKRSSSADSSRFLEDVEEFDSSETLRKSSLTNVTDGRRSSSPCIHRENDLVPNAEETEDDLSISTSQSQPTNSVYIRRSESVPCKAQNRDSSSSNDSGVSTGSLRHRTGDFEHFELPMTTALSAKRHQRHYGLINGCVHASLPRRSKSSDPLRELSFQFQRIRIPEKSTSAEAEVPICPPKGKGFTSPSEGQSIVSAVPYIDSRSTSSGTSDMSDYIETLSLSSHSSSDAPEILR